MQTIKINKYEKPLKKNKNFFAEVSCQVATSGSINSDLIYDRSAVVDLIRKVVHSMVNGGVGFYISFFFAKLCFFSQGSLIKTIFQPVNETFPIAVSHTLSTLLNTFNNLFS